MKETFINRIAQHIKEHYDLQKQELTVVFPNKRAAFYLRSEFQKDNATTIWLPQILSIQEAMTQWSGKLLVDNIDMLFELIDIDAELRPNSDSDLKTFGSQAAQMAKDFDEIDQYDVDAEQLFNYVLDNKKLEIWDFDEEKSKEKERKYLGFFKSLYKYYTRLRERLEQQGKGYYGMITKHLAHLDDNSLCQAIGERKIIFAGFNALTKTEDAIIDKLVKNGLAEVIFDYDSYYIDDTNNEAGLFARRYRLTHPKWMENSVSNRLLTEEKHIHIISASGNTLQAKALQAKLQANNDSNAAIILADEKLLIPVLNSIPCTDAFGDFKVSMGYPVNKTTVNQLIKEYFSIQRWNKIKRKITIKGEEQAIEGWYIWHIFRIMDLELVRIIFSNNELQSYERWKKQAGENGKFIFEDSDFASFDTTPDIKTFLHLILKTKQENEQKAIGFCDNILQLLSFIANKIQSKKEPKKMVFLLNQVSEIGKTIIRIKQVVERHPDYANDIKSVEILYRTLSSGAAIKLNSSSTNGLQIMGLLETRNLDFSKLHVLSVNEGILPTDKSQSSFIPSFIKRVFGLPGYTEKQAVFAYHFYHLLQNGNDINLYYNNLASASGGEPSRFILQIEHELARHDNIKIVKETFATDTSETTSAIANTAQKQPVMDKIKHILTERGLSPTSLSSYIDCPMKFYLKYIMGINDNSFDEEMGANTKGTIIHRTLEILLEGYKKQAKPIDKEEFKLISSQKENALSQAIEESNPRGMTDIGYNYLNKLNIHQQLENYLNYTSLQLKDGKTISIIDTESELYAKCDTSNGSYAFKGNADRIDRFDGTLRVIDYKTGEVGSGDVTLPYRFEDQDDLEYLRSIPAKALQLLLYQYMFLKNNPSHQAGEVQGCIHALKYSNQLEFPLRKLTRKPAGTIVPFLEDDTFIDDMEKMLSAVVEEISNPDILFTQTEDTQKCKNCDFKEICRR